MPSARVLVPERGGGGGGGGHSRFLLGGGRGGGVSFLFSSNACDLFFNDGTQVVLIVAPRNDSTGWIVSHCEYAQKDPSQLSFKRSGRLKKRLNTKKTN